MMVKMFTAHILLTTNSLGRKESKCKIQTYTLACGFFLEKSQASPRSDILTWPCSSSKMLAGFRSLYTM